jgi:signal transduction histidine kinase
MVHSAYGKGQPYALAFVDMRMPPGWDGLETIENLWYVDPTLEIVICTAYSDHPWEDVSRRVGDTDKLLILMKPFNSIEVVQLAHSLTKKWNLAYSVKQQIQRLESSARQRAIEWCEVNNRIQERIAMRMTEIEKDVPQGDAAEAFREKEEFLAIMSYEILTPVNELASTVGLLLDGPLDPVQRAHATTIERCAQDLMALHTGMHEFMAGPRQEILARVRQ